MRQPADQEDISAAQENQPRMQVGMVIYLDKKSQDQRRYNKQTTNKVAVVFRGLLQIAICRHLRVPKNGNTFRRISTRQSMCDPLLPNRDQGWNCNLQLRKKDRTCEKLNNVQDDPGHEEAIEYDDDSQKKRGGEGKGFSNANFIATKLCKQVTSVNI